MSCSALIFSISVGNTLRWRSTHRHMNEFPAFRCKFMSCVHTCFQPTEISCLWLCLSLMVCILFGTEWLQSSPKKPLNIYLMPHSLWELPAVAATEKVTKSRDQANWSSPNAFGVAAAKTLLMLRQGAGLELSRNFQKPALVVYKLTIPCMLQSCPGFFTSSPIWSLPLQWRNKKPSSPTRLQSIGYLQPITIRSETKSKCFCMDREEAQVFNLPGKTVWHRHYQTKAIGNARGPTTFCIKPPSWAEATNNTTATPNYLRSLSTVPMPHQS